MTARYPTANHFDIETISSCACNFNFLFFFHWNGNSLAIKHTEIENEWIFFIIILMLRSLLLLLLFLPSVFSCWTCKYLIYFQNERTKWCLRYIVFLFKRKETKSKNKLESFFVLKWTVILPLGKWFYFWIIWLYKYRTRPFVSFDL